MGVLLKTAIIYIFITLLFPISTLAGPVPDTGQTKCYNNTMEIPCPQPGEMFYGQDAQYTINPHSYTKLDASGNDLADEAASWVMVRDNVTGLIWEVKTDDGSIHDRDDQYTWYEAKDIFVPALNAQSFGGFSDWRLPTVKELSFLIVDSGSTPLIDLTIFPNGNGAYWTETTHAKYSGNGWWVVFGDGGVVTGSKSFYFKIRAVRGGNDWPFQKFVNNGHSVFEGGTVTDTYTGLMWKKEVSSFQNWEDALSYSENLEFAGYDDWRVPNINEIISIVPYNRWSPALDPSIFIGLDSEWGSSQKYTSATTRSLNPTRVFYADNSQAGIAGSDKNGSTSHELFVVRGGQPYIEENIYITSPVQAELLHIDSETTITWDTKDISGDVRILLSRNGGKIDTYETIVENTENDGEFVWWITGPESLNCYLKIEPIDHPGRGNALGLFSIRRLHNVWISQEKLNGSEHIKLLLNGLYSEGLMPLITDWSSSDPSIGAIDGNEIIAHQNGRIEISTSFEEKLYKKGIFLYNTFESMEVENNNTKDAPNVATFPMSDGIFYRGSFPAGDVDHFKFTLAADSILDLGYLSYSTTADMHVEVFDDNDSLMASGTSTNGQSLILSVGLPVGVYYLRLTSAGDIDQDNYYVVTFKTIASMPAKSIIDINLGDSWQDNTYSLEDASEFTFSLAEEKAIRLQFSPKSGSAKYLVEILDDLLTVVNNVQCLEQKPVNIESRFDAGSYTVRVTPVNTIDANNPFKMELTESTNQLEVEPNNTYQESNSFDTNKPMFGRMADNSDEDFFEFSLSTPKFLELEAAFPESSKNFSLKLYKESDQNLIDGIDTINGEEISLHMGLGVGRYFIKITSDGSDADTINYYTLSIDESVHTKLEIEPNNTIKFANAIDKESPKNGRIYSSGDIDYYGFHLSQLGLFNIAFTSTTTTGDYKVYLVDENDQPIDNRESTNGAACNIDGYQLPGNFYIRVENNGNVDQHNYYELILTSDVGIAGIKNLVSLKVTGSLSEMALNDTQTLSATAGYSDATSDIAVNPSWSSFDDTIAIVSASGLVTATGEGSTTIIATYGGVSGRYDIKVGAPQITYDQHHGNLILVAGGGVDANNTLRDSTQYLSDLAYGRFRSRLFSNDDIYYHNPMIWHDVDGDGYDDNIVDDGSLTVAEFGNSITNWAATQSTDGPLYVYLIDHGGIDKFNIFPNEILTAAQLNTWLNTFQAATGRKVVVVIEACKSGSFTDDLTADGYDRVVITSTDNLNAYLDLNGRISFSQFLIDSLYAGDSLNTSYQKARTKLSNMGLPYSQMVPQLAESPALLATDLHIGGSFAIAGLYPEFAETSASQTVAANQAHTFFATLSDLEDIDHVWATVIPPGYTAPEVTGDLESPEVTLPNFDLTDPDGDGRYEGDYGGFVYNDIYKLTFYASNANGNVTVSSAIDVTVTGGTGLDSDGDGMPNDWEDQYSQLDSAVDDATTDPDNDTLTNFQEYQHDTHPGSDDTDNDGMKDGWEVSWGFNPNQDDSNLDADQDGVSNVVEFNDGTNPIDNNSFLDHILPTVTSIYPVTGEVHVSREATIQVSFDEAMDTGSISISNLTVQGAVSGTHVGSIAYDAVNQKLTLVPDDLFEYGELVNVTVSKDITDLAGNPLDGNENGVTDGSPADDYAWSFTVEDSPAVTPTNPYDANADWMIGDFELLDAIDAWATGPMATLIGQSCDVDFYMLDLVDLWKLSTYSYDDQSSDSCFPWIQ